MGHAPTAYVTCIAKSCHEYRLENSFFILQAPETQKAQVLINFSLQNVYNVAA